MGLTSVKKTKKKAPLKDYISWFEIPAVNFEPAVAFYNHIYDMEMKTANNGEFQMAFFPANKGVGGAIVSGPSCEPSQTGSLVYLNGGTDLNLVLGRVEAAGGRIVMPKTLIDKESGFFAIFIDSEGNKLALHSNK